MYEPDNSRCQHGICIPAITASGMASLKDHIMLLMLQVKVAARPLAGSPGGSPQGALEGDSPSSQGQSSAAGSPWSPVSSPDWHTNPRWPQFANFGAHSSRPANPSTLSHVTSAVPCYGADTGTPDSQVPTGYLALMTIHLIC